MTTGPQFTAAIAPVTGLHEATFDRYMRELRAAGLIPLSGRGGGKSAIHITAQHAAAILLSLGSPLPGGAVEAANNLGQLHPEDGGGASLSAVLADEITRRAKNIRQGNENLNHTAHGWELTLSLDPLEAWLTWTAADGSERRQYYREDSLPLWLPELGPPSVRQINRGIRRLTIITVDILNEAADLYADTLDHKESNVLNPLAPIPGAKTENGVLPGTPHIQDPQPMSPHSSRRKSKRAGAIRQAASNGGPGRLHQNPRINPHAEERSAY